MSRLPRSTNHSTSGAEHDIHTRQVEGQEYVPLMHFRYVLGMALIGCDLERLNASALIIVNSDNESSRLLYHASQGLRAS